MRSDAGGRGGCVQFVWISVRKKMVKGERGGLSKILSVVIPVYNAECYLPDCLNSVLSCAASDIEVICVNDGSTDHSRDILKEYVTKDERVIVIDQKNQGPSAARNHGVSSASGQYVLFIDCDDQLKPGLWNKFLTEIRKHPEIELFMTDFVMFFSEGNRRYEKTIKQITQKNNGRTGMEFIPILLRKRQCFWNVWRCAYSRDFLKSNGICFREGCNYAEDLEYTAKALLAEPAILFLHCPYYCYRVQQLNSLTGNVTIKQVSDGCNILRDCVKLAERSDFFWKQELIKQFQFEMIIGFAKLYELPQEDRSEILIKFRALLPLLKIGTDRIAHCVYFVCTIIGMKRVSWMLHILKNCKRAIKKAGFSIADASRRIRERCIQ